MTEISTSRVPPLEFNAVDLQRAYNDWGCNCGPSALAACCRLDLIQAKRAARMFARKKYMNPADMHAALKAVRMRVTTEHCDGGTELDIYPAHGLCLIQWGGPWVSDKYNSRWASCHTHWIASKLIEETRWIFDINQFGWKSIEDWSEKTLPLLLAGDSLRDGTYWLKHSWEVRKKGGNGSRRGME